LVKNWPAGEGKSKTSAALKGRRNLYHYHTKGKKIEKRGRGGAEESVGYQKKKYIPTTGKTGGTRGKTHCLLKSKGETKR